eukprot:Colp12_sorted_trinity150504_noHs@33144
MSRIIVKNLPKHITPERLREHFAQKGEITDVKLAKTDKGVFRRFGYIGFKTEKEAEDAVDYFNKTFVDTSKIEVEIARAFGDDALPRPWSRYSKGSSANQKAEEKKNERIKAKEELLKAREEEKRKKKKKKKKKKYSALI